MPGTHMAVQPPTAAAAPLPRAAGSCVSAEPDAEPGPHGARPAMARVGTHRAAPPFVLGDATAQKLDAVVAASAARLSQSGLAGFWDGADGDRRRWVMQLPTGAGHDVLALFLQGLPGLTVTPQSQRFRTAHERLDSLVAERWRLAEGAAARFAGNGRGDPGPCVAVERPAREHLPREPTPQVPVRVPAGEPARGGHAALAAKPRGLVH